MPRERLFQPPLPQTVMENHIQQISLSGLAIAMLLIVVVMALLIRWKVHFKTTLYATLRMLTQLIAVGFLLHYVFEHKNPWVTLLLLLVMLLIASWIALRPIKEIRMRCYPQAFIAIACSGVFTLIVIIAWVIQLTPWHDPRFVLPLAGMIFANSMNSVSLAADRFFAETKHSTPYHEARNTALKTALLPITNSFLAAGLVALPGIMTGQILAGVPPLIAIRYQIMVLCMIYGTIGLSAALFLRLQKKRHTDRV